jgi:hypothetical protein
MLILLAALALEIDRQSRGAAHKDGRSVGMVVSR